MTDDQIKQVVFGHTKLNPNQADDQVLLDGIVRAVRELMAQSLVGYVHARATLNSHGNEYVPTGFRTNENRHR